MAAKQIRNRVTEDRLWDLNGEIWTRDSGTWMSAPRVQKALATGSEGVMYGRHRPPEWLTNAQALDAWSRSTDAFEVPGQSASDTPEGSSSWAAQEWRLNGKILVGFYEFH